MNIKPTKLEGQVERFIFQLHCDVAPFQDINWKEIKPLSIEKHLKSLKDTKKHIQQIITTIERQYND